METQSPKKQWRGRTPMSAGEQQEIGLKMGFGSVEELEFVTTLQECTSLMRRKKKHVVREYIQHVVAKPEDPVQSLALIRPDDKFLKPAPARVMSSNGDVDTRRAMVVLSTDDEWSTLVSLLRESVMDKELSRGSKRVDLEFVLHDRLVSLHRADIPPDATDEIVSQAVNGCFRSCKDGISAFLVLIRGGQYTAGQTRLVKLLQAHFGAEAFGYLVVVSLEDAKMTNALDDTLLELIDACDGRYCRLTTSEAQDKVSALVSMVDHMLAESGGAGGYSQATLDEAERGSAEDASVRMLKRKAREAEAKTRAFGRTTARREERRAKEVEELRAKHAEERREEAAERRSYQAKKETLEEAVISHQATLRLRDKPDDEDTNKLSVVLLGLSGSGKTSALNLISARAGNGYPDTGSDDDEIPQPTVACTRREVCAAGRRLVFVDTPELWDGDGVENPEKVKDCLALALPGPHVFLLVLQVGRFTRCESLMPAHLRKVFGRDAAEHAMVLFVHMDRGPKRSPRVHEYVAGAHVALQELLRRCGSRYYELSLAPRHKGSNYRQVRDLLAGIEKLAASHGGRGHIVKRFSLQELQDRKKALEDNKDAPWEGNFLLAED